MPDNTREEECTCPIPKTAGSLICIQCRKPHYTRMTRATPPREEKHEHKYYIEHRDGITNGLQCDCGDVKEMTDEEIEREQMTTPPNKQPEAWTPELRALSEAWWNYWNYQGTPDRDLIQNWWFEKITSQRASDVRRLEGLKVGASRKIDPWSIEVAHIEDVKSYNAGIDQAIALLTDSK